MSKQISSSDGNSGFQVGERVLITNEFLRYPENQRKGVIALIQHCSIEESASYLSFSKKASSNVRFIVVALDNPLATRPSALDYKFSQESMINVNRIYSIKAANARSFIKKIQTDYDSATPSTLYCCDSCSRVLQFCDLMPFQSFLICKSHLCPWNEVHHEPNLTEIGPLYCRIHDIAQRSQLSVPSYCEAKAMLFKSKYDKLMLTMKNEPYKVRKDDLLGVFFMDIFGRYAGRGKQRTGDDGDFEVMLTIKDSQVIQSIPFGLLQYYLVNGFENKFSTFRQAYRFPIYAPSFPASSSNINMGTARVIARPKNSAQTTDECLIHITSPFFKIAEKNPTIHLRPGATLHDLWDAMETMPYSFFRQKFHLFVELPDHALLYGQSHFCFPLEEVIKINQDNLQHVKGMHQLTTAVTLAAYREHPIVSPPLQLHALIGDFPHNEPLVAKTVDLSNVYIGFRRIKGDGNCYYRAVMFSFLEQLVAFANQDLRNVLIDTFVNRLKDSGGDHDHLIGYLNKLKDCPISLKDFVDDIIHNDERLDIALVVAAKSMLTHYILTHRDDDVSGTTLENLWLAYYGSDEIRTLEECCETFIGRLDLSAEGPFVNMGLIFKALGCGGMLVMMDRRVEVPLSLVHCPPPELDENQNSSIVIHLLLRPGHFDLLYPDPAVTIDELLDRYKPIPVEEPKSSVNQLETQIVEEAAIVAPPSCIELSSPRTKLYALWNDRLQQFGICYGSVDSVQDFQFSKRLVLSTDMFVAYQYCDPQSAFNFPDRPIRFLRWEPLSTSDDFSYVVVLPQSCVIVRVIMGETGNASSEIASTFHTLCCVDLAKLNVVHQLETAWSEHFGQEVKVSRPDRNSLFEFLNSAVSLEDAMSSSPAVIQQIELLPAEAFEKIFKVPIQCLDVHKTIGVSSKVTFDKFLKNVKAAFGVKTSTCQLVAGLTDGVVVTADKLLQLLAPYENDETESSALNLWDLKYCHVCESQPHSDSVVEPSLRFRKLTCCNRCICGPCLNKVVDGCEVENLFAIPEEEEFGGVPELVAKISCPHCNADIPESVLQYAERYNDNYTLILTSPKKVKVPKVRCALGYLDCADELLELEKVVQLGCDHFICHDCLQGTIKDRILKAKPNPSKIVCPACPIAQSHATAAPADPMAICFCIDCMNFNNLGPHIITQPEMRNWVDLDIIEQKDFEDWERINLMVAAKDDPDSIKIDCRCNAIYFISIRRGGDDATCPYGCGYKICVKCKQDAHPGVKCEDNIGGVDLNEFFPRSCENCGDIGTIPINCDHITCEKCAYQYCFLCVAPYRACVTHDTSYHRPGCCYYCGECCEDKCRQNGKAKCDAAKFKPGPCDDCTNNNRGNLCNHSDWRACGQCVKDHKVCNHNACPECKRLGRLCDPPSANRPDGTPYKLYKRAEVEAKRREMEGGQPN